MHSFLEDFKAFALKGNVVDLAVAVVIGGAFGKIVSSLVANIVTPLLGVLLGGIDLTSMHIMIGAADVTYGVFLQSIIDFLIIALVIFITLRLMNRLWKKEEKKEEEKPKELPEDIVLLREIRDSLRK